MPLRTSCFRTLIQTDSRYNARERHLLMSYGGRSGPRQLLIAHSDPLYGPCPSAQRPAYEMIGLSSGWK